MAIKLDPVQQHEAFERRMDQLRMEHGLNEIGQRFDTNEALMQKVLFELRELNRILAGRIKDIETRELAAHKKSTPASELSKMCQQYIEFGETKMQELHHEEFRARREMEALDEHEEHLKMRVKSHSANVRNVGAQRPHNVDERPHPISDEIQREAQSLERARKLTAQMARARQSVEEKLLVLKDKEMEALREREIEKRAR